MKSLARMDRRNNQAPKRGKEDFFMISIAKKGFFLLVLTAIIVSGVFAQAPTLDKLKFSDSSGNTSTYSVAAANKQISGDVVIPATHNGKAVKDVTNFAFENCTGITSVTIPNSVELIHMNVFGGCTNLTSITFQKTSIGIFGASSLPGDLRAKYQAGGAGTYTRQPGGTVWTKQGGTVTCPTCGGTGVVHL